METLKAFFEKLFEFLFNRKPLTTEQNIQKLDNKIAKQEVQLTSKVDKRKRGKLVTKMKAGQVVRRINEDNSIDNFIFQSYTDTHIITDQEKLEYGNNIVNYHMRIIYRNNKN